MMRREDYERLTKIEVQNENNSKNLEILLCDVKEIKDSLTKVLTLRDSVRNLWRLTIGEIIAITSGLIAIIKWRH